MPIKLITWLVLLLAEILSLVLVLLHTIDTDKWFL